MPKASDGNAVALTSGSRSGGSAGKPSLKSEGRGQPPDGFFESGEGEFGHALQILPNTQYLLRYDALPSPLLEYG